MAAVRFPKLEAGLSQPWIEISSRNMVRQYIPSSQTSAITITELGSRFPTPLLRNPPRKLPNSAKLRSR